MSADDRLVRIIARGFIKSTGLPEDDLVQEGMLALMRARDTFDEKRDVKFETYASRVITNRFIDLQRKRHDDAVFDDEVAHGVPDFNDRVALAEIKKILREHATDLERAIFNSYVEGFSYDEISKIFELPRKKIDNTVQKVKKLIKERC